MNEQACVFKLLEYLILSDSINYQLGQSALHHYGVAKSSTNFGWWECLPGGR